MAVSCERCGVTHFRELRENGSLGQPQLAQLWWCHVDGTRIRLCLGCAMELRRAGQRVILK